MLGFVWSVSIKSRGNLRKKCRRRSKTIRGSRMTLIFSRLLNVPDTVCKCYAKLRPADFSSNQMQVSLFNQAINIRF